MSLALAFICLSAAVVDGDTLRCANVEQANGRVRLARIDAPEVGTPGAAEATAALKAMLIGPVECRPVDADPRKAGNQDRDPFGRIVAYCSTGGQDLGARLLAQGHAVKWPKK